MPIVMVCLKGMMETVIGIGEACGQKMGEYAETGPGSSLR